MTICRNNEAQQYEYVSMYTVIFIPRKGLIKTLSEDGDNIFLSPKEMMAKTTFKGRPLYGHCWSFRVWFWYASHLYVSLGYYILS